LAPLCCCLTASPFSPSLRWKKKRRGCNELRPHYKRSSVSSFQELPTIIHISFHPFLSTIIHQLSFTFPFTNCAHILQPRINLFNSVNVH
jgi:hypothetical protein